LKRTIQATKTIYATTILNGLPTTASKSRFPLLIAPYVQLKDRPINPGNQEESCKTQLFGSLLAALLTLSISVFLLILSIGLLYVILFELKMLQILS